MKKLFICIFFLASTVSYAQTDSIYLIKSVDKMTKATMFLPNRYLKLMDKTGKSGFEISPIVREEKTLDMLFIKLIGIGACHEDSELIVLFKDGENINISSFGKYNCDATPVFFLNDSAKNALKEKPIEAIRVTNGYTSKSATVDLKKRDQRYFVQLFKSLN